MYMPQSAAQVSFIASQCYLIPPGNYRCNPPWELKLDDADVTQES